MVKALYIFLKEKLKPRHFRRAHKTMNTSAFKIVKFFNPIPLDNWNFEPNCCVLSVCLGLIIIEADSKLLSGVEIS